jgi:putative FmdB family regulatory protein
VPTYEYACTDCGDKSEVVQRFSDDPLTICTECGGKLRKVFSPVGIVFKGSGFYRTDSRNGSGSAVKDGAAAKGSNGSSAESAAGSSSSESSKNGSSETGSSDGKAAKSPGKSDSSGSEKKSSVSATS